MTIRITMTTMTTTTMEMTATRDPPAIKTGHHCHQTTTTTTTTIHPRRRRHPPTIPTTPTRRNAPPGARLRRSPRPCSTDASACARRSCGRSSTSNDVSQTCAASKPSKLINSWGSFVLPSFLAHLSFVLTNSTRRRRCLSRNERSAIPASSRIRGHGDGPISRGVWPWMQLQHLVVVVVVVVVFVVFSRLLPGLPRRTTTSATPQRR